MKTGRMEFHPNSQNRTSIARKIVRYEIQVFLPPAPSSAKRILGNITLVPRLPKEIAVENLSQIFLLTWLAASKGIFVNLLLKAQKRIRK